MLSRIKSSKSYLTRDYTPDYFKKISHEVYGTIHRLIYTDEHENLLDPFDFHTGLTCLLAMKNRITSDMQIADEETKQKNIYQVRNSMFKLLEHKRIIYNGMEWYESEWQTDLTELKNAKRQYSDCLTYMEQTCMMILKYDVMQEQEHFNKIIGRLSEQYKNEKQSLQEYFKHIQEWYYKHICAC